MDPSPDLDANNNPSDTPPSIPTVDAHWPSLPAIRTNSRARAAVSPESIAPHPESEAGLQSHDAAELDTPSGDAGGEDHDVDRLPHNSLWSRCFPMNRLTQQKWRMRHPTEVAEDAMTPQQGTCRKSPPSSARAAGRHLRSLIGLPGSAIPQYSTAMAHFSGPLNQAATVYGAANSLATSMSPTHVSGISPTSGRKNATRVSAGSGRRGGRRALFTMIPAEIVGRKKKPQGYESDEPTSPHVTCIGRVSRQKKKNKKQISESGSRPAVERSRRLSKGGGGAHSPMNSKTSAAAGRCSGSHPPLSSIGLSCSCKSTDAIVDHRPASDSRRRPSKINGAQSDGIVGGGPADAYENDACNDDNRGGVDGSHVHQPAPLNSLLIMKNLDSRH